MGMRRPTAFDVCAMVAVFVDGCALASEGLLQAAWTKTAVVARKRAARPLTVRCLPGGIMETRFLPTEGSASRPSTAPRFSPYALPGTPAPVEETVMLRRILGSFVIALAACSNVARPAP